MIPKRVKQLHSRPKPGSQSGLKVSENTMIRRTGSEYKANLSSILTPCWCGLLQLQNISTERGSKDWGMVMIREPRHRGFGGSRRYGGMGLSTVNCKWGSLLFWFLVVLHGPCLPEELPILHHLASPGHLLPFLPPPLLGGAGQVSPQHQQVHPQVTLQSTQRPEWKVDPYC